MSERLGEVLTDDYVRTQPKRARCRPPNPDKKPLGDPKIRRLNNPELSQEDGKTYLPVGIVHVDPRTKLVLIELPHEAETGANRGGQPVVVKQDELDKPVEAFA